MGAKSEFDQRKIEIRRSQKIIIFLAQGRSDVKKHHMTGRQREGEKRRIERGVEFWVDAIFGPRVMPNKILAPDRPLLHGTHGNNHPAETCQSQKSGKLCKLNA